jgi:hypothetical protein
VQEKLKDRLRAVRRVVGWAEEIAVFIGLFFGLAVFLETLIGMVLASVRWLIHGFGGLGAKIIITAAVLGVGALAHWFKKKNQRAYGFVEVLFGLAAAANIVFSKASPKDLLLAQWAGLVACTYVVARGLNNRFEGEARKREELKRP